MTAFGVKQLHLILATTPAKSCLRCRTGILAPATTVSDCAATRAPGESDPTLLSPFDAIILSEQRPPVSARERRRRFAARPRRRPHVATRAVCAATAASPAEWPLAPLTLPPSRLYPCDARARTTSTRRACRRPRVSCRTTSTGPRGVVTVTISERLRIARTPAIGWRVAARRSRSGRDFRWRSTTANVSCGSSCRAPAGAVMVAAVPLKRVVARALPSGR